jgi:three-Cys-motif partner protein
MARVASLAQAADGYPARRVGGWSKEKLHYVQRYCSIFSSGMRNLWLHRVYVDLFCGPGRCIIEGTGEEIDGSPVIAYKTQPAFTRLLYNDIDPKAISALKSRTTTLGATEAGYFTLDCNEAVEPITRELDALPVNSSLSLCFIDPTNWQMRFSSVERLTRGRRMDLIVVFHSAYMKRVMHLEQALTAFFGDDHSAPEWREIYARAKRDGSSVTRAFLDHYRQHLERIGYVAFHDQVSVNLDFARMPLYQMLFASKHPRGEDFWRKIAGKQHGGQLRLNI